ncbi:MAG: serine hydrolase domain-containing protein, partial [Parvularculaceae bacterium]
MNDRLDIKGFVRPGLENVIDAFAGNFERGDELGARFSAYREGELVADLWAGWADREKSEPFGETTLCGIFSSGKAAMATLVAEAVSRGELDYEMRIAALWPEFAAGGKDAVTLAMAL